MTGIAERLGPDETFNRPSSGLFEGGGGGGESLYSAGVRIVIDIKLSTSSMATRYTAIPDGAYSGPVGPGALLPAPHRAENEPPTQGDNQLVSASVLTVLKDVLESDRRFRMLA